MRFTNWLSRSPAWPFRGLLLRAKPGAFLLVGFLVLPQSLLSQPRLEKLDQLAPPFSGFTPRAPAALAASPEDHIYLLDGQLACIARLTPEGELLNLVGGPGSGQLQFSDPADLCINSGLDLFVADWGNDRIVRLNRWLNYLSEFRSLENTPDNLTFEKPLSVVQGVRGDLFIADGGNDRILKIAPNGQALFSFGAYGEERGSLSQPRRIELDPSGGIWVLDGRGHVVHFDEFGGYVEEVYAALSGHPSGLALSAQVLWVCSDSLLWIWDRAGRSTRSFLPSQIGLADSLLLVDLACRNDQLWLLDSGGSIHRYHISPQK